MVHNNYVLNGQNLTVTITEQADGITLRVTARGIRVDRTDIYGWGFRLSQRALAARLKTAIEAGVVFDLGSEETDVNGKTYISAAPRATGRRMNAFLKRMGY